MKLIIEEEVHEKVMYWVNKANFEVSGFGVVEVRDQVATVKDAILIEQEGTPSETEMKAEDINRAEYLLRDSKHQMKWWWHSHVKMSCFWSGTDKSAIEQLGKQGWFFHTVFNQKDEYKSAFSCPYSSESPFTIGSGVYFKDDVETEFPRYLDTKKVKEWDASYAAKVKEKTYAQMGLGPQWDKKDSTWGKPDLRNRHQQYDKSWGSYYEGYEYENGVYRPAAQGLTGETKEEIIKEVKECMSMGWENSDIEGYMADELFTHKLNLQDLRNEFIRDDALRTYGGMYD